MAGKEAVQEADVVTDKNPKTQTDKARAKDKAAIKPSEVVAGNGERQGQCGGNQHHAGNRAHPENQQIEQRPLRLANGAQNEEGNGRGSGEAVYDADEKRAQGVKEAEVHEGFAQPTRRGEAIAVMLLDGRVRVPVKMKAVVMFVDVGMRSGYARVRGREFFAKPFHGSGEIENAKQDQHQANGEFQG